jgi:hypothetical protein
VALSPNAKKEFRKELVWFCLQAESFESRWGYSQRRPYSGLGAAPQTWHTDDCSAYVALCFYWAMRHSLHAVSDPLNCHFSGIGNTQTAIAFLENHRAPAEKYRVGDMAIYGSRWDTKHITICRKAGTSATSTWSSMGSDAGPRTEALRYRSDLVGVYRHPALL